MVTRELIEANPSLGLAEANRQAAVSCEARVRQLIDETSGSFSIETVLSTDKYKPIVLDALKRGFGVQFVYVLLGSPEEAIERVRLRVSKGGHDVPQHKIRERWPRSLANLPWFWEHSAQAFVMYNGSSTPEPILVASRSRGRVSFNPAVIPVILTSG